MISITASYLIFLFYGWSKLGDEGLDPQQPYIQKKNYGEEDIHEREEGSEEAQTLDEETEDSENSR